MRWVAIALLNPHWHGVPLDGLSRQVTPDVTYEPRPAWLKNLASDDFARDQLGEHAQSESAHCLCVRYEADACAPPDSPAQAKLSPHDEARRALNTAALMVWLSRRTSFGYDTIILASEGPDGWTWREITTHDVRLALPSYQSADVEPEDFEIARRFAAAYENAKSQGTVRMATHAVGMALTQSEWPLRYLSLWLALESLFGPEDPRETTFRLCQRIALVNAPKGEEAVRLFKQVNESYRWRSKVAHGLRLKKLEADRSVVLLEELEELVHRSLRKLLENEELLRRFDSGTREEYLDHLALT